MEFQRLVTLLGEFVSFPTVSSDSGSASWEDVGCGKARHEIMTSQKMVGRISKDFFPFIRHLFRYTRHFDFFPLT